MHHSSKKKIRGAGSVTREILQVANLLSLSRVFLLPVVGYFMHLRDAQSSLICIVLIALAGLTDGLDGYFARRLDQVGRLGIALDPLADKIFAAGLVVLLVLYRDLPVWLASVIVGRDLLIGILGLTLIRGKDISLPSNLIGKYTFTAIVVLLASYVIGFDFGISLFMPLTLVFIALSIVAYGRVFFRIRANQPPPVFRDKPALKLTRGLLSSAVIALFLIKFYLDMLR